MSNDSELLIENGLEKNTSHALDISEYSKVRRKVTSLSSNRFSFVPGPTTSDISFDESWLGLLEIIHLEIKEVRSEIEEIRSEFRQLPETRWVQNLRHPAYHLRQPIPVLIARAEDTVNAVYDDIDLRGTGDSVETAISDLCAKIVARYDELGESAAKSQEYTFLKRIIEEVEPPAWQELKQLYRKKLEQIPYVRKGYIKIDGEDADVIIVLSEESVEKIEQLAGIDLGINLQFRPLYFFVEYKSSEDYLELDDFERFY